MANKEHLKRLKRCVEVWNQWREKNPKVQIDLRDAILHQAILSGADLSDADLSKANLREANLRGANLSDADLSDANLLEASLAFTVLSYADLSRTRLCGAQCIYAKINDVDFTQADLRGADLSYTNLCASEFKDADLSSSNLAFSQVLDAGFNGATLTGACIESWQIGSTTDLSGAKCAHVFRRWNIETDKFERRLPVNLNNSFAPGEFSQRFQILESALETIDLTFTEGIDWTAFFGAFQELRQQWHDNEIFLQGVEQKRGTLIIRLEVSQGVDESVVENKVKELYETKLTLMEQRYRDVLHVKEGEIVTYKKQSANLMEILQLQLTRSVTSEPRQTINVNGPVGNLVGANYGNMSAIQNNYGPNTEDITCLLTALRDQAQTFPTEQKDEANDVLHNLERDLKEEQPDQGRISRQLRKLLILGGAIGTIASRASGVSGDVSTFTTNVFELTEKLGIPIEQVQPPSDTP